MKRRSSHRGYPCDPAPNDSEQSASPVSAEALVDVDPGLPVAELAGYGLEPSVELQRAILARVEQREQIGSAIEFALGSFAELTRIYAMWFAPSSAPYATPPLDSEGETPWNKE